MVLAHEIPVAHTLEGDWKDEMLCDGTLENGVNDVNGLTGAPINVAATWEEGLHVLRPNNEFIAVTRELDGDVLIWSIIPVKRVSRMRRVDS